MQQALVSVISPCYNVAPYIGRFLDSLVTQTYKNLEIILVNDGATDNTGEIIENYIPKLEAEGYKVIYLEQENGGQSSAVNNALKHVTGRFLTWPDPDDWLTPDSIEKRVTFLEKHPDVGMVRCNIESIDAETGDSLGLFEKNLTEACEIENAFEKLVFCKTWFGAMACMLRMSCFDEVLKDREIYVTKRGGQNWQMMLPIAQKYPCWQLPDVLGYYCVRNDSHSHSSISFESQLNYSEVSENVLSSTLFRINASSQILAAVHAKYTNQRFELAKAYSTVRKQLDYYLIAMKSTDKIGRRLRLSIVLITPNIIRKIWRKLKYIFNNEH